MNFSHTNEGSKILAVLEQKEYELFDQESIYKQKGKEHLVKFESNNVVVFNNLEALSNYNDLVNLNDSTIDPVKELGLLSTNNVSEFHKILKHQKIIDDLLTQGYVSEHHLNDATVFSFEEPEENTINIVYDKEKFSVYPHVLSETCVGSSSNIEGVKQLTDMVETDPHLKHIVKVCKEIEAEQLDHLSLQEIMEKPELVDPIHVDDDPEMTM